MYKIIKCKKRYFPRIKELTDKFPLPDLSSPLIIVREAVVDSGGRIIAAGFVKLIGESILTIDSQIPERDKADIIDRLLTTGSHAARAKGLDELNAFIKDNNSFVNFLINKEYFIGSNAKVLVRKL